MKSSGDTTGRRMFQAVALVALACLIVAGNVFAQEGVLPPGVKAVWDMSRAWRETTPTRERICVNGLWRWQPARTSGPALREGAGAAGIPESDWGYFKVPGSWPGITDYMQKDSQTVFRDPSWRRIDMSGIVSAWYQREISVPREWTGRRITLYAEYINSSAAVYLDGAETGTLLFPAGELDITAACRPGEKQVLSLRVTAMPLKAVMLAYTDSNSGREVKGSVQRRGLCGDVYLGSAPKAARIAEVSVDTSVRKWEITFHAALDDLPPGAPYRLRARINSGESTVTEFESATFSAADLRGGRWSFTSAWRPDRLWDIHTPGNLYSAQVTLVDAQGRTLDAFQPQRFGFREFWIDGRDFYLNGTRLFLSSVPLDNAQVGVAWSTYEAVCESLRRLKAFGINYVYTHNYGCEPGAHLSFAETLRAADDVGMLVGLSQPHFSQYDWSAPDADTKNNYARHAAFYVGVARNHPSVVFYPTSHNATGYADDMNPDMIDGVQDPRDPWSANNTKMALRAEAIIRGLDPARIVYHHSSGNLSAMHTVNFYANWAPVQEMDDWFEHWSVDGKKPVFTCEYSVPFTWDWAMYRGWYKGKRSFGSAAVPWEFCFAEWNAQFAGDGAYRISEMEKANLRWEANRFRAGALWHRWDYPYEIGGPFEERYPILAMYLADNWRAFRTWGMSANSPWEHGHYWKLRQGVDKGRKELKVDWETLQRPGFSPDYIEDRYQRMDLAFERTDWIPTAAAEALYRNNMPLLAYVAGKPAAFTSKDHNFVPGQTVEKQIIVINNSRETVTCDCSWTLALPNPARGKRTVTVRTGDQERTTLNFLLPPDLAPGAYDLTMTAKFATGETQTDAFVANVLPPANASKVKARIALFDPKGETARLLAAMGVRTEPIGAGVDLSDFDVLIVGKGTLAPATPGPDVSRVRDGLKVVVFEQTGEALEQRFGFRTAEYGLRRVFKRLSDHPLLAGIGPEHLRDWRGEATIVAPRLTYTEMTDYGQVVRWCGIPVTRVWRCGNRGNVASVLIEKPARGNFLPILDGGFSLQYSPLMEYREGRGMVLFCQMDVTGRTEPDPAARALARNIMEYVSTWKPAPIRKAVYAGDEAGKSHLESAGVALEAYRGGALAADQVLVVGPGGGAKLAADATAIAAWLRAGGHVLAVALDEQEANAFLPLAVRMTNAEHIASAFEAFPRGSPLAGVGPADVHSREPRQMPLVSAGALVTGDGILACADKLNVVFSQLAPWQYDRKQQNLKRTFRHASFLTSRLLANMGVSGSTPLLERLHTPVDATRPESRYLDGFYLDTPEEWDDPYRFFRW